MLHFCAIYPLYLWVAHSGYYLADVDDFTRLNQAMRRRKKRAFRTGTVKNHISMFRSYLAFCQHYNLQDLDPAPLTLCLYLEFLARSFHSHRSILNYLSAVRTLHNKLGAPCSAMDSYDVHLMQRALSLTLDRSLPMRQPITVEILTQLLQVCDASGPYGVIYRCIFTMAFFGMFRLSNLVPPTASSFTVRENLCSADVWEHPPGLIVMSRWSKTRQRRGQTHFVGLPRLKNQPDLCPVRSHCQYRAIVPAGGPTVPMFRTPNGRVVTQAMVREALRLMLRSTGHSPSLLTFHGFRKGGAQLCYSLGVDTAHIKAHGGWASDCVWDYIAPGRHTPSPHVPQALSRLLTVSPNRP